MILSNLSCFFCVLVKTQRIWSGSFKKKYFRRALLFKTVCVFFFSFSPQSSGHKSSQRLIASSFHKFMFDRYLFWVVRTYNFWLLLEKKASGYRLTAKLIKILMKRIMVLNKYCKGIKLYSIQSNIYKFSIVTFQHTRAAINRWIVWGSSLPDRMIKVNSFLS